MELPVSFADYTRTLLGDEDYKELVTSRSRSNPSASG